MKSHNKHPQWHKQPLRLTKEQKHNPHLILKDFFECYHLNEVREQLWNWLVEVLSSSHGISCDPNERNNHIYFYEKLEELVEAAFVTDKKNQKRNRKQKRRKLRKKARLQKVKTKPNLTDNSAILNSKTNNVKADVILNKPKQLIEHVENAPLYVINEIFRTESLDFLHEQLHNWQNVAFSADSSVYEDAEQRSQLIVFNEELQTLIDSLFLINALMIGKPDPINMEEIVTPDLNRLITDDQLAMAAAFFQPGGMRLSKEQLENPMSVLTGFFERFPLAYINRELNDFLEAGICYAGPYPDNMSELQLLYISRNIRCLIEAAYQLLSKAKIKIQ